MRELRVFYGGTFDPVHNGHLAIARAAHDALAADIHMMPAADPPHRAPPGASAIDRAAMLQLAIAGGPGLLLDRRELDRGGRSWSIETLHALRAEFGSDAPIAWLVGVDSFVGLPTWKSWRELFELAHFVVAERPGSSPDDELAPELARIAAGRWIENADALRRAPAGLLLRLNQPLHAHSATDLRDRIAAGLSWRHLLPPAVADYIAAHDLYGRADGAAVIGP
ncbi:MAG: nicotinate-nucleotide adenylyltransferase [Luteimonas sp.]